MNIGRRGRGRGEFIGPGASSITGDTLFVIDEGNRRINLFLTTNGNYLRSVRLPVRVINRLAVDNKNKTIYISTPLWEQPIAVLDYSGNIIEGIGEWRSDKSVWFRASRGGRQLALYHDRYLIIVLKTYPIIRFYDLINGHMNELNLESLPVLKPRLNKIEDKYSNIEPESSPYITATLFADAFISGDMLYIPFYGAEKSILQLDLTNLNMIKIRKFDFANTNNTEKLYFQSVSKIDETFLVYKDIIYTFINPLCETQ
ncbi:MAG: hypothetical protein K9N46_16525 [Candidatus Marinimicrobia bacterium]|nr:hypothetical protein [Candidatus Neomarinimicrobiota bacterium]MCF7829454.1 hypothetical protein [Candidatus Neomarinimicrobiota bacterium]MCF7882333.1 hypothetical protein [Candidatus Neomarinimicrobiota bacterium]